MSPFVLSQDIIDQYNEDGAVLIKGKTNQNNHKDCFDDYGTMKKRRA
jgi:hypothetical protein